MTRLDRYVLREVLVPFGFALVAVVVLVFLLQAHNLAGAALGLALTPADALVIFAAALPPFLVLAVPMAYLTSVVIAFARLSGDLEVSAFLAGGASPWRLAAAPIFAGWIVSALMLPVAHMLQPLGLQELRARLVDVALRNMAHAVEPGTFRENLGGVTLYADATEGDALRSVMIYDERDPKAPMIVTAESARLLPVTVKSQSPVLEIELRNGEMHLANERSAERYDRISFGAATIAIDAERELRNRTRFVSDLQQMSSAEMLSEAKRLGPNDLVGRRIERDYYRRFAFPSMALVFGMIGCGVGIGARREKRARSALLSILSVVAYYMTTRVGDGLVSSRPGTGFLAAFGPNVLFLILGLVLVARAGRAK